jgi:hypothetical protein
VDLAEHADHINEQARGIAIRAGAIVPCRFHPDVTIDLGNPDAEKRAYAMGTNHWKKDDMMVECTEFMDAIKYVIDWSADGECPECARLRDE